MAKTEEEHGNGINMIKNETANILLLKLDYLEELRKSCEMKIADVYIWIYIMV